ncbi:MAG TPA: SPW repeat protein [Polyangiaceae bacterium]|nr:SPW repeat protein [Polyangiaceae bacterium]
MALLAPPPSDIVVSHRFERARVANLLLGLWLVASAVLWRHFADSRLNTWLVGALVATFALLTIRKPSLRWANALLGAWLLLSTVAIIRPVELATWWNNLLVAVGVIGFALLSHRGNVTTVELDTPISEPRNTH